MTSSGEVADLIPLKYPALTLPCQAGEHEVASQNDKMPSLEPVFGLSVLDYCRNMAVQHGKPWKRTDFLCRNKKAHSQLITQSWNSSATFAVWHPVDSDTDSGGKPHYSWATVGGGEFPFLTFFSTCRSLFTVQLFIVRCKNRVGVERPRLSVDLFTSDQFTRH